MGGDGQCRVRTRKQLVVASDGRRIGADQSGPYEYLLALSDSLAADGARQGRSLPLPHPLALQAPHFPHPPHDTLCDCGCRVPRALSAATASTPSSPAASAIPFIVLDAQIPSVSSDKALHLQPPATAPVPATSRKPAAVVPVQCTNCGTSKTSTWRRDPLGRLICNACKLYLKAHGSNRPLTERKEVVARRSRCGKALARAILLQHVGSPSSVPAAPRSPACKIEEE